MKNPDKKIAKKELELTITEKFMAALTELGHDAGKLKREVKKASKFITKKIERKLKEAKPTGDKADLAPVKQAVKKAEKSAETTKKSIAKKTVKVEKVIAGAAKVAEKRKAKPVANGAVVADAVVAVKPAEAAPVKKAKARPSGSKPVADKAPAASPKPKTDKN